MRQRVTWAQVGPQERRQVLFKDDRSGDNDIFEKPLKPVDAGLVSAGVMGVAVIVGFFALLALIDLVVGLIAN